MPRDKGDTFVQVDPETAEQAVREFSEGDEDDYKTSVRSQPAARPQEQTRASVAVGSGGDSAGGDSAGAGTRTRAEEDDFDIAVDVGEFDGGAPTKPLDSDRLDELLAACEPGTPTPPDPLSAVAGALGEIGLDDGLTDASQAGVSGAASSTDVGLPAAPTSAWLPAVGADVPGLLAIDFGTSYSSVAVVLNGRTHVLPLTANGLRMLPSVVGIDANGHAVVGEQARQMLLEEPANVISSPKRLLGRAFNDTEVEPHLAQMAMTSSAGPRGDILLHARGRVYTVEQLCAPLLHWLRRAAADQLGRDIGDVVVTVPVGFDVAQRRGLSEAATMAGLRIRRFLDEPTAAVLANRQTMEAGGLVAVYDFGGGTFDFSVVELGEGGQLSVVANAGDTWLGGDDFDEVIASAAANAFWRNTRVELRNDVVRWQRLLRECERAKRELSRKREATIHLTGAALTARGPIDLTMKMTREEFAELSRDLIQRTMDTCETALSLSDLSFSDLDAVYMSGGTSYIPAVMDAVAKSFGQIPRIVAPPDLAVVLGAAAYTSRVDDKVAGLST